MLNCDLEQCLKISNFDLSNSLNLAISIWLAPLFERGETAIKALSGRELAPKATEGVRVTSPFVPLIWRVLTVFAAGSFHR